MAKSIGDIAWESLPQALEQRKALGHPWVLYHEPQSQEAGLLIPPPECIHLSTDWAGLVDGAGYLIAPFAPSEETPIVFLDLRDEGVQYRLPLPKGSPGSMAAAPAPPPLVEEVCDIYRGVFATFAEVLWAGQFDKLVLARQSEELLATPLDLVQTFLRATHLSPSAYTHLLYTPQTGVWLGCTPELLLSASGCQFETMALAGTRPAPLQGEQPEWSEQHRREQALVTEYISQTLTALGIEPNLSSTYSAQAGNLIHLRTDITGRLTEEQSLPQLLSALHPTPAVCGLPKAKALDFIQTNEAAGRSYYSGCLGQICPEGESRIYVNLRCAQILSPHRAMLYAGGGLLPSSCLEDEWIETERKLHTMRTLLCT